MRIVETFEDAMLNDEYDTGHPDLVRIRHHMDRSTPQYNPRHVPALLVDSVSDLSIRWSNWMDGQDTGPRY